MPKSEMNDNKFQSSIVHEKEEQSTTDMISFSSHSSSQITPLY